MRGDQARRPRARPQRRVLEGIARLLLVALAGCRSESARSSGASGSSLPAVSSAPATPANAAELVASAEPTPASAPPTGAKGAEALRAAEASAALDEATLERRTFRQILVGDMMYPPKRLTWTLFRGKNRLRLDVLCQAGVNAPEPGRGISLTGQENDETKWSAPVRTRYAGTRDSEGQISYRLPAESGAVGETGCQRMPRVLLLACHPEQISVLRPGAALIVGRRGRDDESAPFHWQPAARDPVASLRCDISPDSEPKPWRFLYVRPDWPLVFVAPTQGMAGVEWAHENGDAVVQQGAYRWIRWSE